MRTIAFLSVCLVVVAGCSAEPASLNHGDGPISPRPVRIARFYETTFDFPTPQESAVARSGEPVVLTFKADPETVASGADDPAIRQAVSAMSSAGGHWFFGYWHEPEISLTPDSYRAAFEHVASVVGNTPHVQTISILMASTFSEGYADLWYPGKHAVDVIGVDGYNWMGCFAKGGDATAGAVSRSFAQVFAAADAFALVHGKPLIAAEFGSAADPAQPQARLSWLQDAARWLSGHPEFLGSSYFDHGTSFGARCNWNLDAEELDLYESLWRRT